ncbi:glutathione S-transferase 1-like [Hydractinia symbiolongicarpus]|uniref:glutathione S-transferase 1-like n=1 Tax=Hydractinia symbiolongicarpus TaxID=13093 RepID=UPI00254E1725|nr:glutathione S-transferase 1-like [Hydractinia symbiolongicarpus]
MCDKKHSLFYFDVNGRGESIIMTFKHAGVEFEDHRISFAEFPEVKYNTAATPTGHLPVLTTPRGDKLVQSASIVRYLGNLFNLYGDNLVQRAHVDAILDTNKELYDGLIDAQFYTPVDDQKKEKLKILETKIKEAFKYYEYLLKQNDGNPVFVGSHITIADIHFIDLMDIINLVFKKNTFIEDYNLLNILDKETRKSKHLSEYLAERNKK